VAKALCQKTSVRSAWSPRSIAWPAPAGSMTSPSNLRIQTQVTSPLGILSATECFSILSAEDPTTRTRNFTVTKWKKALPPRRLTSVDLHPRCQSVSGYPGALLTFSVALARRGSGGSVNDSRCGGTLPRRGNVSPSWRCRNPARPRSDLAHRDNQNSASTSSRTTAGRRHQGDRPRHHCI
jgi:hypothetical protein